MDKFDSINNYYENLVFDRIDQILANSEYDNEDFYNDAACIALNQLPPHYVRHIVDAGFYLTQEELETMTRKIDAAVEVGIEKVREFRAGPHRTEQDEARIQEEIEANKPKIISAENDPVAPSASDDS